MNNVDQFLTENVGQEILIFKYSPICSISRSVEKSFNTFIDKNKSKIVFKVDVLSERSLSKSIAEKFNIIHESPQLIWLDENHQIKNHASHYEIIYLLEK